MAFNRPIPDDKRRDKSSGGLAALVEAEKLMQIALLLPSAAFIGWLGGAWLDGVLHQRWIGIFGIVFGGVSGLVYVVRLAVKAAAAPEPGEPGPGDGDKAGSDGGKR